MAHQRALCASISSVPIIYLNANGAWLDAFGFEATGQEKTIKKLSLKRLESSGNEQQEARSIDDASWALARESQINRYMRMCTHEKRLKER